MFKSPNFGQVAANPKTLTQLLQVTFDQLEEEMRKADPVGHVILWPGLEVPSGWLTCDHSSYNMTRYPELYATIGTTFGSTATTFQVPPAGSPPANMIYIIRAE